jgi:probable phosphoglycerate mutase
LAEALDGKKISAIYASDLSRARETAQAAGDRLGLPVHTDPGLREVDYGECEGVPCPELPVRYLELFSAWQEDPAGVKVPGGESFKELAVRVFPAFCRIAEKHPDENVFVVGHKSTNRVILCCLLGMDVNIYKQIGQGNCAINVVERRKDGRYVVDAINEMCHLGDE